MPCRSPFAASSRAIACMPVTPVTPSPRALALIAPLAIAALAALAALATPAQGQILPTRRAPDPRLWISAGPAMFQSQSINDGRSNTVWQLGTAIQYRAAAELGFSGGTAVGLTATIANVPMTYYSSACQNGCDGDVTIRGLALGFHAGASETGLHQIIEASAGVVEFMDFDIDASDQVLGVIERSDVDFSFQIGYGIGFQISPRFQVGLVQDVGVIWHQKDDLPADASNVAQQRVTRLTVRYGLGQRARAGVRR